MNTIFSHPSSASLFIRLKDIFKSKSVFQRRDRSIIFLCGGSVAKYSRTMRKYFLTHSAQLLPDYPILLAETAITDITQYNEREFINLADFENLIVEISDCILIFPESSGSIAELGFFTNNTEAIKKILVINNKEKQHDSFINNGLIARINSKSNFCPSLIIDNISSDFHLIERKISDRLKPMRQIRLEYKKYSEYNAKQKMYIIYQLLYMLRLLTFNDLVYCISKIYKKLKEHEINEIKYILSIMVSSNFILRKEYDSTYFITSPPIKPFIEIKNIDMKSLQMDITGYYQKHHSETYNVIGEVFS